MNLDNYSLIELLNLFHLEKTFDDNDLKKAKLMALKTHPDKSGLDEKIFIFFKNAYDRIEKTYNFRAKGITKICIMKVIQKWWRCNEFRREGIKRKFMVNQ